MIVVTKINNKNFTVNEHGQGEVGLPAIYASAKTENGNVSLNPVAGRVGRGFSGQYGTWGINGSVPSSALECMQLLNEFVGNFNSGGGGSGTPSVIKPLTITENGVYNAAADNADGYNPVTVEVAPSVPEWQPHPDWWDIKAIFDADPDPNKRFIVLLADSENDTAFLRTDIGNLDAYYKMSDGATYTGSHTWDRLKDKPCSDGYKTRYMIVSSPDNLITCNIALQPALWVHFGNGAVIRNFVCGNSASTNANVIFASTTADDNATGQPGSLQNNAFRYCFSVSNIFIPGGVTSIGDYAFSSCASLTSIAIPGGVTSIGNYAFASCTSLTSIAIPDGVTSIGNNAFSICNSLTSIAIPDSVISIGNNAFANCPSLLSFNCEHGWIARANINLTQSTKLSIGSMIDFFNNLGINTGSPVTITLGATNLAKLSSTEKAIATNKGYTLA